MKVFTATPTDIVVFKFP